MSDTRPTFTSDRIEAEWDGDQITIWNHLTVVQEHELGHGLHESHHKVLTGDGSTGERPDFITPRDGQEAPCRRCLSERSCDRSNRRGGDCPVSRTDRPICQHCGRYEENHPAELDDMTCDSFRKRFDLHPETLLEAAESLRETGGSYDEHLASELEGAFDRSPYVERSHYTESGRNAK